MKLVNLYTVKQMILAERDKIRLTVPAASYELVKEKPYMHGNAMRGGIRIALRCLENAPAVDAVPVVRCKDCIHMENSAQFRHCRVWGAINGMGDEGFCNYGERRTDADN